MKKYIPIKAMTFGYFKIKIKNFNKKLAKDFLIWFYGKDRVIFKKPPYIKSAYTRDIYDLVSPILFFNSSSLRLSVRGQINLKNPNKYLFSIFNEKHFKRLFKYWKTKSKDKDNELHQQMVDHIEKNYKKYINEAIIENII